MRTKFVRRNPNIFLALQCFSLRARFTALVLLFLPVPSIPLSLSRSLSVFLFYSRCFPVLHLIIECALSSVLSSVAIRVAICDARRCELDAFQLRFPETYTSCIYIIKPSRFKLINSGQEGPFVRREAECRVSNDVLITVRTMTMVISGSLCAEKCVHHRYPKCILETSKYLWDIFVNNPK